MSRKLRAGTKCPGAPLEKSVREGWQNEAENALFLPPSVSPTMSGSGEQIQKLFLGYDRSHDGVTCGLVTGASHRFDG